VTSHRGNDVTAKNATVRTVDLAEALDYLEGLIVILRFFHDEERGSRESDELLDQLQAVHGFGMKWEPLRYQSGVGQGWSYAADNVAALRERLLEGYANAAL
jgi:hypothetical protein